MGGAGLSATEQVNRVSSDSDGRVSAERTLNGHVSKLNARARRKAELSVKERVTRDVSAYQPEARTSYEWTGETTEDQILAGMTVRISETGKVQTEEERAKPDWGWQAWGGRRFERNG
jgi:hypothetical protein